MHSAAEQETSLWEALRDGDRCMAIQPGCLPSIGMTFRGYAGCAAPRQAWLVAAWAKGFDAGRRPQPGGHLRGVGFDTRADAR